MVTEAIGIVAYEFLFTLHRIYVPVLYR